jgi:hypothetical protein
MSAVSGYQMRIPGEIPELRKILPRFRHASQDNAGLYFHMAQDHLIRNIYSFTTHKQLHILSNVTYKIYYVLVSLNNLRNIPCQHNRLKLTTQQIPSRKSPLTKFTFVSRIYLTTYDVVQSNMKSIILMFCKIHIVRI